MTEPLLPVTVRVNARLQEGQLADSIAGLFADLLARVSPGSHLVSTRLETGPHGEPRAAVAELAIAPQDAEPVVTAIFDLEHGLPRGSAVAINGKQAPFGALAGIAVYLNGTQLDPAVYAAGDPPPHRGRRPRASAAGALPLRHADAARLTGALPSRGG